MKYIINAHKDVLTVGNKSQQIKMKDEREAKNSVNRGNREGKFTQRNATRVQGGAETDLGHGLSGASE